MRTLRKSFALIIACLLLVGATTLAQYHTLVPNAKEDRESMTTITGTVTDVATVKEVTLNMVPTIGFKEACSGNTGINFELADIIMIEAAFAKIVDSLNIIYLRECGIHFILDPNNASLYRNNSYVKNQDIQNRARNLLPDGKNSKDALKLGILGYVPYVNRMNELYSLTNSPSPVKKISSFTIIIDAIQSRIGNQGISVGDMYHNPINRQPPLIVFQRFSPNPVTNNIPQFTDLIDQPGVKMDRQVIYALAHELGHAMGANHTFYFPVDYFLRKLGAGNITEYNSNMEFGWATTSIMGYGTNLTGLDTEPMQFFTDRTYEKFATYWNFYGRIFSLPDIIKLTNATVVQRPVTVFPNITIANIGGFRTPLRGRADASVPSNTYFRLEANMPNPNAVPAANVLCGFEQVDVLPASLLPSTGQHESMVENVYKASGPQFKFAYRRKPESPLLSFGRTLVYKQDFEQPNLMPISNRDLNFAFVVQRKNTGFEGNPAWAQDIYTRSSWDIKIKVDRDSRFLIRSAVQFKDDKGLEWLKVVADITGIRDDWQINLVRFKVILPDQKSSSIGVSLLEAATSGGTKASFMTFNILLAPGVDYSGRDVVMEPSDVNGPRFIFYGRYPIIKVPDEEDPARVSVPTLVGIAAPVVVRVSTLLPPLGAGLPALPVALPDPGPIQHYDQLPGAIHMGTDVFGCAAVDASSFDGSGRSSSCSGSFMDQVINFVAPLDGSKEVVIDETMVITSDANDAQPLNIGFSRMTTLPVSSGLQNGIFLPFTTRIPIDRISMYKEKWGVGFELPTNTKYSNVKVERWLSIHTSPNDGKTFYGKGPINDGTLSTVREIMADNIWDRLPTPSDPLCTRNLQLHYDAADLMNADGTIAQAVRVQLGFRNTPLKVTLGTYSNTGQLAISNSTTEGISTVAQNSYVILVPVNSMDNVLTNEAGMILSPVRDIFPTRLPMTANLKTLVQASALVPGENTVVGQLMVLAPDKLNIANTGTSPLKFEERIIITGENAIGAEANQKELSTTVFLKYSLIPDGDGKYVFYQALRELVIGNGKWKNVRVQRIIQIMDPTVTVDGQHFLYSSAYINPNTFPGATDLGGIVTLTKNRVSYTEPEPYNGDISGFGPTIKIEHHDKLSAAQGTVLVCSGALGVSMLGGPFTLPIGLFACAASFIFSTSYAIWGPDQITYSHAFIPKIDVQESLISGRQYADPSSLPMVCVSLTSQTPMAGFPMMLCQKEPNTGQITVLSRFPTFNGVPQNGLSMLIEEHAPGADGNRQSYIANKNPFSLYPAVGNLSYPNGGEQLMEGGTVTVTWNANIAAEHKAAMVDLSITYDGGATWQQVASTANTGSYQWQVPQISGCSMACRLRVESSGNVTFFDESDAAFTIMASRTNYASAPSAPFTRMVDGIAEPGQYVSGGNVFVSTDPAMVTSSNAMVVFHLPTPTDYIPDFVSHIWIYGQDRITIGVGGFDWYRYGTLLMEVPRGMGYIDLIAADASLHVDLYPVDGLGYADLRPVRDCLTTARSNEAPAAIAPEAVFAAVATAAPDGFSVYLNPTSGYVTVTYPAGTQWLDLYDLTGKLLSHTAVMAGSTQAVIELAHLPGALYMLRSGSHHASFFKR